MHRHTLNRAEISPVLRRVALEKQPDDDQREADGRTGHRRQIDRDELVQPDADLLWRQTGAPDRIALTYAIHEATQARQDENSAGDSDQNQGNPRKMPRLTSPARTGLQARHRRG